MPALAWLLNLGFGGGQVIVTITDNVSVHLDTFLIGQWKISTPLFMLDDLDSDLKHEEQMVGLLGTLTLAGSL